MNGKGWWKGSDLPIVYPYWDHDLFTLDPMICLADSKSYLVLVYLLLVLGYSIHSILCYDTRRESKGIRKHMSWKRKKANQKTHEMQRIGASWLANLHSANWKRYNDVCPLFQIHPQPSPAHSSDTGILHNGNLGLSLLDITFPSILLKSCCYVNVGASH